MARVEGSLPAFEVLGSLRVWMDGQERAVSRPAVRRLLGALLLTPGRLVDRARLIAFVWGPSGCEPAALHSAVYRLREWLRPTGIAIVREGDGYRIQAPPERVDASCFRLAVAGAREEADPDRRTDVLLAALDLWRGPVLGTDLEWPHELPAVAELRQARIDGARDLAEAAIGCGRAADAVDPLRRLAEALPYDESVHTQLITLLGHADRRAEGLRRYEQIRRHLADDLGVDPGPGLRRAHLALLGDDLPTPGPPPSSVCLLPGDLPDFTGREAELERITTALSAEPGTLSTPSMVAICGMPGVGKTALALRAGHRLRGRFPDGQLFADLSGADGRSADVAQVLGRWLRVLGEQPHAIPDDPAERAELLRVRLAGRRVLVVLDNVADTVQIQPLLPAGPSCAALLTSRSDLAALFGMTRIKLPVMPLPEAVALLGRLIGGARTEAEPDQVRRLIEGCGRLPLALRIAGARLAARPHWTVARLADQLERAHRPLDHLALGAMEVRAVLAVGYRALDAPERRLLRLFGLLEAPDIAAWVAAALLDGPLAEAEEVLERLADAQLLEAVRSPAGEQVRYRPHDLVRAFARERAEAEEPPASREAALLRALGGWLALTEDAYDALWGGGYIALHGQAARWRAREGVDLVADPLGWYDSERVNIVAAVEQAARIGAVELCWDLAGSAVPLFEARSHHDEWRRTHAVALAAALRAGDDWGAALTSANEAMLDSHHRGDYERARAKLATAMKLCERTGNRGGWVLAHTLDARIDLMQGRFDDVLARYERTLAHMREVEDRGGQFLSLGDIGELHLVQGRPDLALPVMERAFELAHTAPAFGPHLRARSLWFVGEARLAMGDLDGAEDVLTEARRHAEQVRTPRLLVFVLHGLGLIRLLRDRLPEAEPLLSRALTLSVDIGEPVAQVRVLRTLGKLHRRRGDADRAAHCFTEALAVSRSMRALLWEVRVLSDFAALHEETGDVEAAAAERLQVQALIQRSDHYAAG
ncbi:BTAD domain-containing putative transcriptional regulator [Nonomuraea maheshkhaliensis]|uniref:BTAD domain-containing putative transcriptional regulator n=1 Tax=Nonomuraea maheshkhaliensis TaxID=419590 RepID=A0ABN2F1I4_9ACTN